MPVFLVCVDGSASEDDAQACRAEFEALTGDEWTYPPSFVDQVDEVPVIAPGDEPALRTVGVYVELPEPEESSDEAAARRDVAALIEAMSQLVQRANIEFAVEYREEEIGSLTGGPADARVVDEFFGSL